MQDFSRLLQRLADSGLEFVIIGGFAAVSDGSTYVTRDLDICALLTPENVARLRSVLAEWHPKHRLTPQRLSFLDHPPVGRPLHNLHLETDVGVVDISPTVLGVGDFARLRAQAEALEVHGRTYLVMSLDDLIAAKEALAREKDLLSAKELRAIAAKRKSE